MALYVQHQVAIQSVVRTLLPDPADADGSDADGQFDEVAAEYRNLVLLPIDQAK
ncbi:hypothetical protein [Lignipirellula cremea]|uniref:Uncharacterized protein n=1 Tax=Lignipirellula cremea TaxID=2528010 RepID=A0A518DXM8_9BACT|nr:hypothetical protein [Lignipirellula cremea]QDU96588.1 hypothetical protein Pla8534_44090 [Lignipirellula cremea]